MQTYHHPQNIAHFFVHTGLIYMPFSDFADQRIRKKIVIKITGYRHFDIKRSLCGPLCCMYGSPVRDNGSVKSPFFAQYGSHNIFVFTDMCSADQIIRAHDRLCTRFLYNRLKCREINFTHCTLIRFHIYPEPFGFLIVHCKMLYTCCHIRRLDSTNYRNGKFTGQSWIFTDIFKISSACRCSFDINTRSKNHIFASSACFFSQHFSCIACKFAVPCHRNRTVARTICHIIIWCSDRHPLIIDKLAAHTHRSIGHL